MGSWSRPTTQGSQWPPSPRVESEEASLKHEVLEEAVAKIADIEEAPYRGTVDQYPIILDANYESDTRHDYTSSTDNEVESVKNQSSDDSCGPATPSSNNSSRKQVQFAPKVAVSQGQKDESQRLYDQKAFVQPPPRGRTPRPRIQTDLGSDLQGMITGQRRAPSPYSFSKPDHSTKDGTHTPTSAFGFFGSRLSSESEDQKRYSSARPRPRSRPRAGSDESRNHEYRGRYNSPPRSSHESYATSNSIGTESNLGQRATARYTDQRRTSRVYAKNNTDPGSNLRTSYEYRPKHYARDSPNNSSAEDLRSKPRSEFVSDAKNPFNRASTHAASAEQGRTSREAPTMSLAEPQQRKERPRLDHSGRTYTYHGGPTEERRTPRPGNHAMPNFDRRPYLEPSPIHSHRAMEDYVADAFRSSGLKTRASPHPSPRASPRASPRGSPQPSPPRTPHDHRGSRDYFSTNLHSPLIPSEPVYVQALPHGEGLSNGTKLLPRMLTGAVSGRVAPPHTKISGSSTDRYPREHKAQSASGRRSRNTSPAPSESTSRSSREYNGAQRALRDEDMPRPRPSSRAGSTASLTSPSIPRHDTHHRRTGSYIPPPLSAQLPPSSSRAFSYTGNEATYHVRQVSSAGPTHTQFGIPLTPTPDSSTPMPRRSAIKPSNDKAPARYSTFDLPPCPRSIPENGHDDWYTVTGISQLDVCPSCMKTLRASPFRAALVPTSMKNPRQKVICDFSRPWVRLAWNQIMKQGHSNLDMLHNLLLDSRDTKPCPGKANENRAWYRLPNPETGSNVENFGACSECVRSLRTVFPSLQYIFKRNSRVSETRTCDLTSQSRRFDGYLEKLEAAAQECESKGLREPNIKSFALYAEQKARLRECNRDNQLADHLWHFDPHLPQFTICEECYNAVVWPVSHTPVAKGISRTLRMVPTSGLDEPISCQLYSERMRAKFLECVEAGDFEKLRQVAIQRWRVEQSCQERHAMLVREINRGVDRAVEMEANVEEWKKWD